MNWPASHERSGRYLSPEPLLQSPSWVASQLRSGRQVPSYSYALNNPVRYVDRDGLEPDAFLAAHEALRVCGAVGCSPAQFQSEVRAFQEDALSVFIASVAAYASLEAAAARAPAVCEAGRQTWRNLSFDGPSPGVWHANGRIAGVRWRNSEWGARLDLHPLPGSPNPILHINYGPLSRGEAAHIRLWDPIQWWNAP
jgi:hypothetical protein